MTVGELFNEFQCLNKVEFRKYHYCEEKTIGSIMSNDINFYRTSDETKGFRNLEVIDFHFWKDNYNQQNMIVWLNV